MFTDTHCHLDATEFAHDRGQVVEDATALGVSEIWVPSVEVSNFVSVKACCSLYASCRPAYGIHPLYVMQASDADLNTLKYWLKRESPFAVGEIGLDYFVPGIDKERQARFFSKQLKIARDFELPVLLHVRRAVDDVLKHLRRIGACGGIAHAFNGSQQQAEEFIRLGFKLGFGGAMSFKGSTRIRALAARLPLEAIVLETDAPDMPPTWLNRSRNAPGQLPAIAAVLAELRGITLEEVAAATSANARAVFKPEDY